jgi:hypothetical protein
MRLREWNVSWPVTKFKVEVARQFHGYVEVVLQSRVFVKEVEALLANGGHQNQIRMSLQVLDLVWEHVLTYLENIKLKIGLE